MKFYETNKRLSYVLMAFSSISTGLWISLIVLHFLNKRNLDLQLNTNYSNMFDTCITNYSNIPYGGLPFYSNAAIPNYGYLLAQNFKSYQSISNILLYSSGPFMVITLILSVFLLLKSRVPYKKQWYLSQLQGLKTAHYIFSWLGMITGSVYFGYILRLSLKLGTQDCITPIIRQYADQYFVVIILAAIMSGFIIVNYFISIGIRKQPDHLNQNLFSSQQQSNVLLQPVNDNIEMQKKVALQLSNLPKINQYENIKTTQYPPQGFDNYNSYPAEEKIVKPQPIQQQNRAPLNYNMYSYGPIQSRFIRPSQSIQSLPVNYYYAPSPRQTLALHQIEINIDNESKQQSYQNQINNNISKTSSPNKIYEYNLPPQNKSKKSPIKIFNKGLNGSKQKSIIRELRNRFN